MAHTYFISALLDLSLTEENIFEILSQGQKQGLTYYEADFYNNDPLTLKPLSLSEAAQRVSQLPEKEANAIKARIDDSFFTLFFQREGCWLTIHLLDFVHSPWTRTFPDGKKDVDMHRYLELFLSIVEEYKIFLLEVNKI